MLEAMILNKPILDIVATNRLYEFDFIKQGAVMTTLYNNLEKPISDIILDKNIRQQLSENGKRYVMTYLANPGSASKRLAEILDSY
jgi:glycosyltransferase involved in cell wall biosynthesis